jgi:hypothetical protein
MDGKGYSDQVSDRKEEKQLSTLKAIFSKKNKVGGTSLPNFKIYYKARVIITACD